MSDGLCRCKACQLTYGLPPLPMPLVDGGEVELARYKQWYRDAANELGMIRAALTDLESKMEVESTFTDKDGEDYIAFYRVPCGPWHRVLGLIRGGRSVEETA